MESLHRSHNGLHHLGFVANIVCGQRCDGDGVFGSRVVFADDAKDDQPSGKQRGEGSQPAAFGFEESDEFRRGHGFSILLVDTEFVPGAANGSVIGWEIKRFTSTVKLFLSESSFRPPSGVPVMAK